MKNKILMTLGYIWALPHTLVGSLLLLTWYFPRKIRWSEGCLEVIPFNNLIGGEWVAAQTHGWIIFSKNEHYWDLPRMRVHERVHVKQGMIGGVFFVLAYVGMFVYNYLRLRHQVRAYHAIWFEKQAYKYDREFSQGKHLNAWGSKGNK